MDHNPRYLLQLRPVTAADQPLLYQIYASTREEELARTAWDGAQRAAFLTMQFTAQHQYYQDYYPAAAYQLILLAGEPIGRLYLNRGASEYRIIDIALLPAFRGQGWGSTLLRQLQTEAAQAGCPITIHVERFNPALRLYERLGFRLREDQGVYLLLGWSAHADPASGEDRLVAETFLGRSERHQEELEAAKRIVG